MTAGGSSTLSSARQIASGEPKRARSTTAQGNITHTSGQFARYTGLPRLRWGSEIDRQARRRADLRCCDATGGQDRIAYALEG